MHCDAVIDLLLSDEAATDARVGQHLDACQRCQQVAGGLRRLDNVLRSTIVVQPPLEVQHQLAALVDTAVRPRPHADANSWWSRLLSGEWLRLSPNMAAAQGLAAMLVALVGWQVFGWLNAVRPVIGDVGYAMQLVAASPASIYMGGVQVDLQSLGMWSLVGAFGWLVSAAGPVGRWLARRIHLP